VYALPRRVPSAQAGAVLSDNAHPPPLAWRIQSLLLCSLQLCLCRPLLDAGPSTPVRLAQARSGWQAKWNELKIRQTIHGSDDGPGRRLGDPRHRETSLLCYAQSMLRGVFQRAAVATLLMGAMLAPLGICLQPAQKMAHSCCAAASNGHSTLHRDCCTARAPLPAVVVAPNPPVSAAVTVASARVSANEASLPGDLPPLAIVPPQSPPTGAFILRI